MFAFGDIYIYISICHIYIYIYICAYSRRWYNNYVHNAIKLLRYIDALGYIV